MAYHVPAWLYWSALIVGYITLAILFVCLAIWNVAAFSAWAKLEQKKLRMNRKGFRVSGTGLTTLKEACALAGLSLDKQEKNRDHYVVRMQTDFGHGAKIALSQNGQTFGEERIDSNRPLHIARAINYIIATKVELRAT